MNSKFFKFGLMAILALGVAACDDDNDNNNDKGGGDNSACSASDKKCDGDYVMICNNGSWQKNEKSCPNGCEAGACKTAGTPGTPDTPDTPVCTEGVTDCDGDNLVRCLNNAWTTSKCDNGCDAATKKCKVPADVPKVCTEGESKCNGNNLETCLNNTWTSNKCDNGCDSAKKVCKAADVPTTCTDKEAKCSGKKLLTCKSNQWIETDCPNGCDNGACKQAGSGDIETYCDGQVLHMKDSSGAEDTFDCSQYKDKGVECQKLKDNSSNCVYNHKAVEKVCTVADGIVPAGCMTSADAGLGESDYEMISSLRCVQNSNGELVGVPEITVSSCGIYDGNNVAVFCKENEDKSYSPTYLPCSASCDGSKLIAVCDGKQVSNIADLTPSYPPEKLISCDDYGCKDSSGSKSCSDTCKDQGDAYCYVVIGESKYFCSAAEQQATGKVEKYDPYDLKDCDDAGCVMDDNGTKCSASCKSQGADYCYLVISDNTYMCSESEKTALGEALWYCGDKEITPEGGEPVVIDVACAEQDPNTIGICDGNKIGCRKTCTSKGAATPACEETSSGSFSYNIICKDVDGKLVNAVDYSSLTACTSTCNDAATACK